MSDDEDVPEGESEVERDAAPTEQTTVDAGSIRQFRRRAAKRKIEVRDGVTFWRGVLADPVGRREIWGLILGSGALQDRFAAGPTGFPDPYATWYHLGQQSIGRQLLDSLTVIDFEAVHTMRCEHDPRFAEVPPLTTRRTA